MKTAPIVRQRSAEEMRNGGYTEGAVRGITYIRDLHDEPLLRAVRDDESVEHAAIVAHMSGEARVVPWINPFWVTATCAEEAYDRGLIDEQELDWYMR